MGCEYIKSNSPFYVGSNKNSDCRYCRYQGDDCPISMMSEKEREEREEEWIREQESKCCEFVHDLCIDNDGIYQSYGTCADKRLTDCPLRPIKQKEMERNV